MKRTLSILALLLCIVGAKAQHPIGFAYYDVDRLYDTIPALFYDDSEFTPSGRMHWTSARYERKIARTAAVLDSMHMNIVAISGVETEEVVRDLAAASHQEYSYLHRTLNSFTGLDIALLYHADLFDPIYAREGRGWLYIEGLLEGQRIGLLLCSSSRYAAEAIADCREEHPGIPLIFAGHIPADPHAGMVNTLTHAEKAGRGNIRYDNGWRMADRIQADTTLRPTPGDVFARHWLIDIRRGIPLPTFRRNFYRGGYARTLPVFTYITMPGTKE